MQGLLPASCPLLYSALVASGKWHPPLGKPRLPSSVPLSTQQSVTLCTVALLAHPPRSWLSPSPLCSGHSHPPKSMLPCTSGQGQFVPILSALLSPCQRPALSISSRKLSLTFSPTWAWAGLAKSGLLRLCMQAAGPQVPRLAWPSLGGHVSSAGLLPCPAPSRPCCHPEAHLDVALTVCLPV